MTKKEKIVISVILALLCCFSIYHNVKTMNHTNTNDVKTEENYATNPIIEEEEIKPTLYDTYSPDELNTLFGVVEAETRGCEFDVKCNVVSVIFNRIEDPRFGYATDIKSTVLAPGQFSVVSSGAYKTVPVTQDTIDAVEYVFEYGDTAADSVFFESMKSNIHGSYAKYTFNDGKHKFYK